MLHQHVLRPVIGRTAYPLQVHELEPHAEVGFEDFVIAAFPVKHRVEAYGYAFVEDDRPGRFDVETARALGVEEGPDFGRLQRGETVNGVKPEQVVGEDRPGRRIVYSGDTAPVQTVEVYAHKAELLVHEATFCEDERARARETGHTTARQAAELARAADVKLLALTHLSTRYYPREVRDESRAVFENTIVPRDFDAIEIPFPERGEPHLVKAELEPAS
jgi:ribonuclease Z